MWLIVAEICTLLLSQTRCPCGTSSSIDRRVETKVIPPTPRVFHIFILLLSLVYLPISSKGVIGTRLWWRKAQCLLKLAKQEQAAHAWKTELSDGFQRRILKATFGVRAARTVFWLVGHEIMGWCFRSFNHQPLVPASLRSICFCACGQHGKCLSFCRITQRYSSDSYVYPLRRN